MRFRAGEYRIVEIKDGSTVQTFRNLKASEAKELHQRFHRIDSKGNRLIEISYFGRGWSNECMSHNCFQS